MKARLILSENQTGNVELTPENEFERRTLAIFGDDLTFTAFTEMEPQGAWNRSDAKLERAIVRFAPRA